jgi:hypothetical protein
MRLFSEIRAKGKIMSKLQIPGTTIQYDNPNQLNAAAIDPKTGTTWVPWPVASGTTSWGGCQMYPGPTTPQPGTYDATLPKANPVLFNVQSPSLSVGGIQIPNSTSVVKNPA